MTTIYQVNPRKPILHLIYHYNDVKDALKQAREIMACHYKVYVVSITDRIDTYIGEPSGILHKQQNDEEVLKELLKLGGKSKWI